MLPYCCPSRCAVRRNDPYQRCPTTRGPISPRTAHLNAQICNSSCPIRRPATSPTSTSPCPCVALTHSPHNVDSPMSPYRRTPCPRKHASHIALATPHVSLPVERALRHRAQRRDKNNQQATTFIKRRSIKTRQKLPLTFSRKRQL